MAQLNGGENDQQGQVIRVNLNDGREVVLADQLDKPTGIAVLNNELWIATRDALLHRTLEDGAELETVLEGLPNNGRSNGTLTVTPDNKILYETSGNKRDSKFGQALGLGSCGFNLY